MGEWGDTTFDRSSDAWGSVSAGFEGAGVGETGGTERIELIGTQLRVAGTVDLNRFRRVADFVNIVDGYIVLTDAVFQDRAGEATGLAMPELRVLHHDLAIVGQQSADPAGEAGGERRAHRLVFVTRSHIVEGDVIVHGDVSIMALIDATDPRFIPMSDVTVRWLSDRSLAARYPFALLQRTHILGFGTEGITAGGAGSATRPAFGAVTAQSPTPGSAPAPAPSSSAWPAADMPTRGPGEG